MTFREKYNSTKDWLNIDVNKLLFLKNLNLRNKDLDDIKFFIHTMNDIKSSKYFGYLVGEDIIDIKSISENLVNIVNDKIDDEDDEDDYDDNYYDEDGYYTNSSLEDLSSFFKNLDDKKILAISRGSVEDDYDLDIDGGRYYLCSRNNVQDLIFSYIFHTKKMTYEEYSDSICNSTDLTDAIEDYYKFYLKEIPKDINELYDEIYLLNNKDVIENFNSSIKDMIKRFKQPVLKEQIEKLESLIINI
jgi:hypothetical protein